MIDEDELDTKKLAVQLIDECTGAFRDPYELATHCGVVARRAEEVVGFELKPSDLIKVWRHIQWVVFE